MRHLSTVRQTLPRAESPLYFSVSGADDLQPDVHQTINHSSPLRNRPLGFANIGIPVRRLIEASGVPEGDKRNMMFPAQNEKKFSPKSLTICLHGA